MPRKSWNENRWAPTYESLEVSDYFTSDVGKTLNAFDWRLISDQEKKSLIHQNLFILMNCFVSVFILSFSTFTFKKMFHVLGQKVSFFLSLNKHPKISLQYVYRPAKIFQKSPLRSQKKSLQNSVETFYKKFFLWMLKFSLFLICLNSNEYFCVPFSLLTFSTLKTKWR